ncbi:MAG: hypothetical protein AB7F35_09970, partial [Acetobacteraceae bacterium]
MKQTFLAVIIATGLAGSASFGQAAYAGSQAASRDGGNAITLLAQSGAMASTVPAPIVTPDLSGWESGFSSREQLSNE